MPAGPSSTSSEPAPAIASRSRRSIRARAASRSRSACLSSTAITGADRTPPKFPGPPPQKQVVSHGAASIRPCDSHRIGENRFPREAAEMTAPPSSLTLVGPYFDAWNVRDPEAVAAAFAEGGTYTDPTVTGPLTGTAIAEHARALLTAFPDLSFEIVGGHLADGGQVITQWLLHGTNTGPWNGQAPTGRAVVMRGTDVFTVTAGKITSVEGYFDRQALAEQLGFQMRPLPAVADPFQFGYAVRVSAGSSKVPGAF